MGEFLFSISDFAEYIAKGALDVARLIADNVGGISGSMRVGLLADAFGLECTPHNWGNTLDLAVHFHLGARAAECLLVRSAVPAGPGRPSFLQLQVPSGQGWLHPCADGAGHWAIRSTALRWTRRPSESTADDATGLPGRSWQCRESLAALRADAPALFPAHALERPEVTFKIFQFPPNMIPRIDGDDRTGRWCRRVTRSAWTSSKIPKRRAAMARIAISKDLNVKVKVGWVKGLNRLYFLYEVSPRRRSASEAPLPLDVHGSRVTGVHRVLPAVCVRPGGSGQSAIPSHLRRARDRSPAGERP